MMTSGKGKGPVTVEEWINDRSDWLRRSASEFLVNRKAPTDDEISALADHCHREVQGQLKAPWPSLPNGAIEAVPAGGELRLKGISDVRGVNALRSDTILDLDQGNVTVIYGTNGSGKTGYSRLIKELCGARAKDDKIYPNVYNNENVSPEASVVISIDGQARPAIAWKAADGPVKGLVSTAQVFDTAAATLFTDKSNPATHEPRAMRFVSGLIAISDRVATELRRRIEQLTSKLPGLPPEHLNTPAALFFQRMAVQAKVDEILEACVLPESIDQEIAELETALAVDDPAGQITALAANLQRNADLRAVCEGLNINLRDEAIRVLVALRKNAETKRAAATAFAQKFFEGIPLVGVGETIWRELWTHAKTYSEKVAYIGHAHPMLGDQARCVLCQQLLSDEAKVRIGSFTAYLEGALETDATAAEQALCDAITGFVAVPDSTFWTLIEASTEMTAEALEAIKSAVATRFAAAVETEDRADLPALDFAPLLDALGTVDQRLQREHDVLVAVASAQGRDEKKNRLATLKAHLWLVSIQQEMLNECDRQAIVKSLDDAAGLAVTNSLTKKNGEIANDHVVAGYQDRFNAELSRLGGAGLPVKLKAKPEGKGRFSFSLELNETKMKAPPRSVLSEGEQRAIALASFLADVTGSSRATPIIFDDPISSLDQDFEEKVAARLVDLGRTRQVIVFTHRLSMIALLENAATKLGEFGQPTKVAVQVIARTSEGVGVPSKIDIFSQKPRAGLNGLIQNIGGLAKVPEDLEPYTRAGLCSTFRLILEKIVEFHLCADVVARYRREVQTKNKLAKLAIVTPVDCELIDEMMSKYSSFVHSQAQEMPVKIPGAQVLMEDVTRVKTWLDGFEQRIKDGFPNN